MISVKVASRQKGDLKAHLKRLERALRSGAAVDAGFPTGKVAPKITAIATYQQYGTSRGIPARPFMTFAWFKGRAALRAQSRQIVRTTVTMTIPLASQMPAIGAFGAVLIKGQIADNTPPPNAPSTLAQKQGTRTLIDTGAMKAAVTWKIV